uniref:Uncharacterized protein n=1 Tax=Glossina palpalis gambiensis TaxID=67801 RepID=A0A1B0BVY3_9MUSC
MECLILVSIWNEPSYGVTLHRLEYLFHLLHYTNTSHPHTHIDLLNQPGSNNVTELLLIYFNYSYFTTTGLLVHRNLYNY